MFTLIQKEVKGFLSSIVGYVVIIVFLLLNGSILWIFPGNYNVLDGDYANFDSLFLISPLVFLFLIPAITMRSFAEEKRTGTIELLLTKPLTDFQIVLAKYVAGFLLVLVSLLPTLVYYYTVHNLGNPPGNLDTGGMWGSYFGLLFLGGGFVSIGLFASSISDNQVVAFVLGLVLCAFCYFGFELISYMGIFGNLDSAILKLGINEHYISMSRGVLDTRDMLYFVSLIAVFLILTRFILGKRRW